MKHFYEIHLEIIDFHYIDKKIKTRRIPICFDSTPGCGLNCPTGMFSRERLTPLFNVNSNRILTSYISHCSF